MSEPVDVDAAVRRLAAVADAELVGDVLSATAAVLAEFDAWRASPTWRNDDFGRRLTRAVETVRAALAGMSDRDDLDAVVAAVLPVLGEFWPSWPTPYAPATAAAVERLRYAAMHRPPTVRQARWMAAGSAEQDR